jgi:hypothetical protein
MKISEMIEQLQQAKLIHGDIECNSASPLSGDKWTFFEIFLKVISQDGKKILGIL